MVLYEREVIIAHIASIAIVLPPIAIASRIALSGRPSLSALSQLPRGGRRRGSASKLSRGVDPPPGSKESTVKLTS